MAAAARTTRWQLLLVPALHARLAQQLPVLLLRHPLTALLDDRTHETTLICCPGWRACHSHAHHIWRPGTCQRHSVPPAGPLAGIHRQLGAMIEAGGVTPPRRTPAAGSRSPPARAPGTSA